MARIEGPQLHHLRDVMRMAVGSAVILFDEQGREYDGRICDLQAAHAIVEVDRSPGPSAVVPLILAAAIIKGPRMDFLIEKAGELGATELWPVLCARGQVRATGTERLGRWRRLAVAAAKQSLAPRAMEIRAPADFQHVVTAAADFALAAICRSGAPPLGAIIRKAAPSSILIACGPEGDFAPEEIAMAEHAGFRPAGLGKKRLRSETAALAALSIAASALHELTGGK